MAKIQWTPNRDAWLIDHDQQYGRRKDLMEAFNKANGVQASEKAITHRCQFLGLERAGGYHCRKDGHSFKCQPVGTERIRVTGECKKPMWFVKVSNEICSGDNRKKAPYQWEKKHLLVWRFAHGEIPKGHKVVFLNGDTLDCRLENLYLTTDAIHMTMIKNNWYTDEPELTRTALICCELETELKKAALRQQDGNRH